MRISAVRGSLLALFFAFPASAQSPLDQALAHWRRNEVDEALPFFERAAREHRDDANTLAWLADAFRRLGRQADAVATARRALDRQPCHAFAHGVVAASYNPQYGWWDQANPDSTWQHLLRGVECDPNDGNLWIMVWTEALRRRDGGREQESIRRIHRAGFIAPAAMAFNRWVLRNLPLGAVLITNGDLDTYPALAAQLVEGLRTDVTVVNGSLLNAPWYAQLMAERYGFTLSVGPDQDGDYRTFTRPDGTEITPEDTLVHAWVAQAATGRFGRPLAALDSATLGDGERIVLAGPAYLVLMPGDSMTDDTTALRQAVQDLHGSEFRGPGVSSQDRSPLRQASQDGLALRALWTGLILGDRLLAHGDVAGANAILEWAEVFMDEADLASDQATTMLEDFRTEIESSP